MKILLELWKIVLQEHSQLRKQQSGMGQANLKESDDKLMPCSNFTDLNGAKELFSSKLLSLLSMPFLTFTVENRYPASRDSLLNKDPDSIVERIESYKILLYIFAVYSRNIKEQNDEPISKDDYSNNNNFTTGKL